MDKLLRKSLSALLCLCMLSGALSACKPGASDETGTDTGAGTDAPGETYYYTEETTEAGGNDDPVETNSYSYSQDFSQAIKDGDADWYTGADYKLTDGTATAPKGGHCLVSCRHQVTADVCNIEADIKSNIADGSAWVTAYIGLRTDNFEDNAVTNAGIWLAFKNSQVGCLTGSWPNTMYVSSVVSFKSFRHVYIEDNIKDNIITVYADNDAGEKVEIAKFIIENDKDITLSNPKGETQTTTLGYDLASEGYVNFWIHLNGGAAYDNLKVSYTDKVPEVYEEYDKTLYRDVYSDTWYTVDDLGRATPLNTDGSDIKDKLIGMFYFPWHTSTKVFYDSQKLYDHTKIFLEGGYDAVWDAISAGPVGWGHYWDEPYFGYYLSNDEWVIRKHALMLTEAGVDFIFLDVTNSEAFRPVYMTIFKVYKQMREEGLDTPDVAFHVNVNTDTVALVMPDLWENLYSVGKYTDIWAMYDGKPLILGNLSKMDEEIRDFFTVKYSWALKENLKLNKYKDRWSWMQEYPQTPAYINGEAEQISVACGMLVNLSIGRSYRNGKEPKLTVLDDGTKDEFHFQLEDTKYGYFYEEQMSQAYEIDPPVLMITGWNEWVASPWTTTVAGALIANTYTTDPSDGTKKYYFVDEFNAEFSRDLEPSKRSIKDNYFYQTAQYLRTFTGSRPVPAASYSVTEDKLMNDLTAWANVFPEYRDTEHDTTHRDHNGFGSFNHYTNTTGRNDFSVLKVARGASDWYFYAETVGDITSPEGENWMNLYINTDADYNTGWYGYDICVGRDSSSVSSGSVSISKCVDNSFKWESVGTVSAVLSGSRLVYKISASLLGISGDFDFKWSDNGTTSGEIMEFMDLGDAAPNDRYNYRYTEKSVTLPLSDGLKAYLNTGIALQTNKYMMLKNGAITAIDPSSTLAEPKIVDGRLFIPITAFDGLGDITFEGKTLTVDGKKFTFTDSNTVKCDNDKIILPFDTFSESGVCYVPLEMLCSYTSLSYQTTSDGVITISSSAPGVSGDVIAEIKNKL